MSIQIFEKIIQLRESEGLSRAAFAEMTDISVNTLKSIEQKGVVPKSDVIQKISVCWPEYAYWLITGRTDYPNHRSPVDSVDGELIYRMYEYIDHAYYAQDDLMTKPEWFSQLMFLQDSVEKDNLYALIISKQPERSFQRQCILISGALNFCDHTSGKNSLVDLARFLKGVGRGDLIKTSGMSYVTPTNIQKMFENWQMPDSSLMMPEPPKYDWTMKLHINFAAWRMLEDEYKPKHRSSDF